MKITSSISRKAGPNRKRSGTATEQKPNGGGQSLPPAAEAWPIPDPAMFHGLAGEVVATILPNTEADAVALLVNYLAYFGNVIGRVPFFRVGETDHYTNIYGVLVGETASRKGTAADRVTAIFRPIDLDWVQRKTGGMSSGEGLIHEIRDPIFVMKGGNLQLSDPGVTDKRQMIEETEFSQVLNVMQRDGNNLSRMVRDAWDCRPVLKTKVRHSPLMVTNPFISIMAHITPGELQRKLDELAYFNGFANRFLFVCVQRSKEVPDEHPLAARSARAPLASHPGSGCVRAVRGPHGTNRRGGHHVAGDLLEAVGKTTRLAWRCHGARRGAGGAAVADLCPARSRGGDRY